MLGPPSSSPFRSACSNTSLASAHAYCNKLGFSRHRLLADEGQGACQVGTGDEDNCLGTLGQYKEALTLACLQQTSNDPRV